MCKEYLVFIRYSVGSRDNRFFKMSGYPEPSSTAG